MVAIKPIRTEEDLDHALARIDEIFDAEAGTPEGDELDVLVDLVELYESKAVPMEYPSAIAAIEFRMDQAGLTQRDLIPFIGSRAKVSEVLSGKRAITISMARALHGHLGISADVLLQEPGTALQDPLPGMEWGKFPLKAMAKAGWIPDLSDLADRAEEVVSALIERAGGRKAAVAPLYRKNNHHRVNAKTDEYALRAWCWQVMATAGAGEHPPEAICQRGTVTPEFLRTVAQLSPSEDGPLRAKDFLTHHGIGLEVVPHLRRTHLDGAALRLGDGRPVIGLTLRYDRIDNFWFCLIHELAHVGLHLDSDAEGAFVDDHTLRDIEVGGVGSMEKEADDWAEEALIPTDLWEASPVREFPTPMAVIDLAYESGVHPAIVAGRVRHVQKNYRLLSQFVGTGEVRRQFEVCSDCRHVYSHHDHKVGCCYCDCDAIPCAKCGTLTTDWVALTEQGTEPGPRDVEVVGPGAQKMAGTRVCRLHTRPDA